MAQVRANEAYLKYLNVSKADLELPDVTFDDSGNINLYVGEVYCRYSDCDVDTKYLNLNNLKKHYVAKHEIEFEGNSGGRPKRAEETAAINWYNELIRGYEAREAAKPKVRPVIPLKKDGSVNMSAMRGLAKEHGIQVPCDRCKADKKSKECCKGSRKEICEVFDEFDEEESTEEESTEVIGETA